MNGNDIIALGLGLEDPWEITGQTLDTSKSPNELRLKIAAQRGTLFPCPVCGKLCHAHDFRGNDLAPPQFLSASLLYHCVSPSCSLP